MNWAVSESVSWRLSENANLPFDKPFDKLTVLSKVEGLMALSKVDPSTSLRVDAEHCRSIEGLRYPHPLSLRCSSTYASLHGISEALHLDISYQPLRGRFFHSVIVGLGCIVIK